MNITVELENLELSHLLLTHTRFLYHRINEAQMSIEQAWLTKLIWNKVGRRKYSRAAYHFDPKQWEFRIKLNNVHN